MIEHELNDLENFEGHHVFADLLNFLDALSLIEVVFDKSFDRSERRRHRYLGLLDVVDYFLRVDVLILHEGRKFIPNSGLTWNLDWLQRFSVHVDVQKDLDEQGSHFKREHSILNNVFNSVKLINFLKAIQRLGVSAQAHLSRKI